MSDLSPASAERRASTLPRRVRIVEVGPRDGLQNERGIVPADDKIRLIDALVEAGLKTVEAGSFVSPKWVPQMADSDRILTSVTRRPDISLPVLVPNRKGLDAALAAGADTIAVFAAATESFAGKNLNASVADSLRKFSDVAREAEKHGLRVRGYVSCAIHCPYEGFIPPEQAARLAAALMDMGCYEISLCDTTGAGTPARARAMIEASAAIVPIEQIAVHFHDTYGQALANTVTCLEMGVAIVDSSVAGLGGCPYSPGAAGNLATEDLVYMLDGMGIETGVDLAAVAAAGRAITKVIGRNSTSRVATVLARKAGFAADGGESAERNLEVTQ
jgi:isopropylmalate/homocitrate/citramalate synthase